jgi:acyl-CoA synthetase (AMP-forming)/AMP-acid ligase II
MTALPTSPFMHASAHWLAFTTLFGGGKVVVLPRGHFDPATTWRLVGEESVNVLVVVGDAMARPLVDELETHPGRYELSSLIAVGSGGAVLSPSTKRRLGALLPGRAVVDAFGSSETGQLGGSAPEGDPFGAPRLHVDEQTDVFDEDLRPVVRGSGAQGLLARSGHIPLGYLGDPGKSATTFVTVDGRRWALPGDRATVEVDGSIVVLGRGSLCINTGGEKVFPDEVEAVLKGADEVADAVVVGLPDELLGERVVAVVSPRPGRHVDAEMLREHCRRELAGYKTPRQILVAGAVERSPTGKADYRWARAFAQRTSGL